MTDPLVLHGLPDEQDAAVAAGVWRLTPRERQVTQAVIDGYSSKQIAISLGISPRTVEVHRLRVLQKLGINSTTELVRFLATVGQAPAKRPPVTDVVHLDQASITAEIGQPLRLGTAALADIITGIAYRDHPDPDVVNVFMSWDRHGAAAGYLIVPDAVRRDLKRKALPSTDMARPLCSAISFGLFLALGAGLPLQLTGEQQVWDDAWGSLPAATDNSRRRRA